MSATMTARSRNLLQTSKLITNKEYEDKYKNTPDSKITNILRALSRSDALITYVVVDKTDHNSIFYGVYGNELYRSVLHSLLTNVSSTCAFQGMSILIDWTSSISESDFEDLCYSILGKRVRKCSKHNSQSNKCIQIADYVAGSIWHMYERNEFNHYLLIKERIRRP